MNRIAKFLLSAVISLLLLANTNPTFGLTDSNVRVYGKLDTTRLRIGEQVTLRLFAEGKSGNRITFPAIPDTFNSLEVVDRSALDTLKVTTTDSFRFSQTLRITSFDSGFHVLPPFPFLLNDKDTLSTEAELLEVRTIAVDTTKAFKDIRPVFDPPFDWRELIPYLIGLVVMGVIVFLVVRYLRKRKPNTDQPEIEAPSIPAHLLALQELEELEKAKLWQQGAYKQYHIRLTEIIRNYIDRRFNIASMEFTTDETLNALRNIQLPSERLRPLEMLLRIADMVKFAKAIPVGPENEASLSAARQFIAAVEAAEERSSA